MRSVRAVVTPKPCVIASLGHRLKRVPTDTRSGAGELTRLPVRRCWPRLKADIPRTEGTSALDHSRPGGASSKSAHVCDAAESGGRVLNGIGGEKPSSSEIMLSLRPLMPPFLLIMSK